MWVLCKPTSAMPLPSICLYDTPHPRHHLRLIACSEETSFDFIAKCSGLEVVHSEFQILHQLGQAVKLHFSNCLHFAAHRDAVRQLPIPGWQLFLVLCQHAAATAAVVVSPTARHLLKVVVGESVAVIVHQNRAKAAAIALSRIRTVGANTFRKLLKFQHFPSLVHGAVYFSMFALFVAFILHSLRF